MSLTQCMSLLEVESEVSLYVSQYMYYMSYCRDVNDNVMYEMNHESVMFVVWLR